MPLYYLRTQSSITPHSHHDLPDPLSLSLHVFVCMYPLPCSAWIAMPQRPQLRFLEAVDDESFIAASAAPTRSTLANSGCAPVNERWDGSGNFVESGLAPTALPLVLSANLGDVCTPIPHFPPSYSYLHSKLLFFLNLRVFIKE